MKKADINIRLSTFLLYLWGIETMNFCIRFFRKIYYFYFTYEELKLSFAIIPPPRLFHIFTLPMRNWNPTWTSNKCPSSLKFLLYLWGIETQTTPVTWTNIPAFLLYLWGIETHTISLHSAPAPGFLLYLWGIETQYLHLHTPFQLFIFTLPMRNWNNKLLVN